jgi:hypothetical protein
MKKKFKSAYLLLSSILISLVSLPFAFAKSATGAKLFCHPSDSRKKSLTVSEPVSVVKSVYDSLHLKITGLSHQAFDYAKKGFEKLAQQGKLNNNSIVAIAGFQFAQHEEKIICVGH